MMTLLDGSVNQG